MSQRTYVRVMREIDRPKAVGVLQEMLRVPNPCGGEDKLARTCQKIMDRMGLETELQEVERGRHNVIGRIRGSGEGYSLMLQAHLDAHGPSPVNVCEGWTKDPWGAEIRGDRIYGNGVKDITAGLAAITIAADTIKNAGYELKGDLVVCGVVGHGEHGIGCKVLMDKDVKTDLAIVSECTDLDICVGNRSWNRFQITTYGKTTHLTTPSEGVDAVEKMAKIILALKGFKLKTTATTRETGEHFSGPVGYPLIGQVNGGFSASRLADKCTALGEVRVIYGKSGDEILGELKGFIKGLKKKDPDIEAKVQFVEGFPIPAYFIGRDEPVVKVVQKAAKVATQSAKIRAFDWTSDTGWMQEAGIKNAVVFGPGFPPIYMPDEWLPINDYIQAARVYTIAALDICGRNKADFRKEYGNPGKGSAGPPEAANGA